MVVLEALKGGSKFPFDMLKCERESVVGYWDWWWEGRDMGVLDRPYTISDSDPILRPTDSKETIDTNGDYDHFDDVFQKLLSDGILPRGRAISRTAYRSAVVDYLCGLAPQLPEPLVIFMGGGYGAGKTSTIKYLSSSGVLPGRLPQCALHGVDYCKQVLPEFNLVKSVSDGRASEICQNESRLISDTLFATLISEKRSFVWDSSMSDYEKTLPKLDYAKKNEYQVGMFGVLTDLEVAKRRAMKRACDTGRFAHPGYLEGSHRKFWSNLDQYVRYPFDFLYILENSIDLDTPENQPIIALKQPEDSEVQFIDSDTYRSYTSNPS
ncbi:zeta toxin family protein [Roseimicrobium sp. ORNL1]|uniref:zeta toxin family protein n=1 Tax=Roseimicrobium sp. ORNL1 TaxID=2711231 RepID=UPI0013E158A6|nr:zeta toxin family protein [Roseimicrobium sp. ORNL1]QIF00071.1 hypothetical protein G5S37_00560 [Roseimicrobium sp. ORNL1]